MTTPFHFRHRSALAAILTIVALSFAWLHFAAAVAFTDEQPHIDKPIAADAADEKVPDFAHAILPILKARCAECHTDGKYQGGFSLDTREAILDAMAIDLDAADESELLRRITSDDPDERMPPKGEPLKAEEIAAIRQWIAVGAPWQEGFTFKTEKYAPRLTPRRIELPNVAHQGWDHPIDRIVAAYFAEYGLELPAKVDDVTYMRRVYLDLIGMLPTPAEVDAFVADDAADKRERLVRKLLADRRGVADHWLTFWNDMLRNDYAGTGYIDGGRRQISQWLYQSLVENKPFDQFTRELISPVAGSEGFAQGIKWRGRVNASQAQELQFSQNVSQVFFGINMKCASCHDSFIDDWKLGDAYSLAATIAERPLEIHRCDKPTGEIAKPGFVFPQLGEIDPALPKAQRLEQLAQLVTHAENGRFSRTIANRIWQRMLGRGIVHPVDVMGNRPWSEDLLDYLAAYLVDEGYDLERLMEHIVTSRIYQSQAVVVREEPLGSDYIFRGPELKRLTAEQFVDAVWMITRTAPDKPNAPVQLAPFADDTPQERRMIRASLVASNPLLRSLGRPNREQVVTTRPDVLSTLQALDLSNGPQLAEWLRQGAAKIVAEKAGDEEPMSAAIIERLYLQFLSRRPSEDERAIALEIVGEKPTPESVADLMWALVMLPEFQLIR